MTGRARARRTKPGQCTRGTTRSTNSKNRTSRATRDRNSARGVIGARSDRPRGLPPRRLPKLGVSCVIAMFVLLRLPVRSPVRAVVPGWCSTQTAPGRRSRASRLHSESRASGSPFGVGAPGGMNAASAIGQRPHPVGCGGRDARVGQRLPAVARGIVGLWRSVHTIMNSTDAPRNHMTHPNE